MAEDDEILADFIDARQAEPLFPPLPPLSMHFMPGPKVYDVRICLYGFAAGSSSALPVILWETLIQGNAPTLNDICKSLKGVG